VAGHAKRLSVGWAIFGAASVVSIVVILIGSRDTVFTGDELGILSRVADQSLGHALFEPPASKYLIAFPTLVYGGIAEVFGAGSYLPYRILGVALVVLAAALLFALARRRAPEPLALGCAILLLFFGAAAEVVAIPARVPGQIAVCAGLGMLLALDTRDRRDDALACALGVVAVISHPVGLAFVGAAGIVVVFGRERGWRTVWVAAVPLAVYALWWLTLRTPAPYDVPLTLGEAYSFARDAFIAVCAALTGIFRSPWVDDGHFITTASHVLAVLAVLGAVVAVARARRVSAGLVAALAALAVALVGPVLAPGGIAFGFRTPDAARYVYPGAVLALLVLVELVALDRRRDGQPERPAAAGGRWTVAVAAAAAAVFVISMVSNIAQLRDSAREYRGASALVEAQFGAFDLSRAGRSPAERAAEQKQSVAQSAAWLALMLGFSSPDEVDKVVLAAPAYYAIKDAYGLPSDDPAELAAAPPVLAQQADRVLVVGFPLGVANSSCGGGPALGAHAGARPISVPGGVVQVTAGADAPPAVSLGRFSGEAVQPLTWPRGASTGVLALPHAEPASHPWQLEVEHAKQVNACLEPPNG
jgi:hypothetical protein